MNVCKYNLPVGPLKITNSPRRNPFVMLFTVGKLLHTVPSKAVIVLLKYACNTYIVEVEVDDEEEYGYEYRSTTNV